MISMTCVPKPSCLAGPFTASGNTDCAKSMSTLSAHDYAFIIMMLPVMYACHYGLLTSPQLCLMPSWNSSQEISWWYCMRNHVRAASPISMLASATLSGQPCSVEAVQPSDQAHTAQCKLFCCMPWICLCSREVVVTLFICSYKELPLICISVVL